MRRFTQCLFIILAFGSSSIALAQELSTQPPVVQALETSPSQSHSK